MNNRFVALRLAEVLVKRLTTWLALIKKVLFIITVSHKKAVFTQYLKSV